jgi:hypothetical protein
MSKSGKTVHIKISKHILGANRESFIIEKVLDLVEQRHQNPLRDMLKERKKKGQ